MKSQWRNIFFSLLLAGALCTPGVSFAQESQILGSSSNQNSVSGAVNKTGLGSRNVTDIVQTGINIFLSVLSLIAVVLVLYGGWTWMTAGGNADKVGEAKKILQSAVIGLTIILAAWAITLFAIRVSTEATTTEGGSGQPQPAGADQPFF